MIHALRRADGTIAALLPEALPGVTEALSPDHPDVRVFLAGPRTAGAAVEHSLMMSDVELVRVLEDVVDLMVAKGLFAFQELPEPAQRKLGQRRSLRAELARVVAAAVDTDEKYI